MNGQAPHRTTGVASAHSIQCRVCPLGRSSDRPGNMAPIEISSSGPLSAALQRKRRDMSASSGLSSASKVGSIGSSAMPQSGQAAGPSSMTSGCIGQVQRVAWPGFAGAEAPYPPSRYLTGSARNFSAHRSLQK